MSNADDRQPRNRPHGRDRATLSPRSNVLEDQQVGAPAVEDLACSAKSSRRFGGSRRLAERADRPAEEDVPAGIISRRVAGELDRRREDPLEVVFEVMAGEARRSRRSCSSRPAPRPLDEAERDDPLARAGPPPRACARAAAGLPRSEGPHPAVSHERRAALQTVFEAGTCPAATRKSQINQSSRGGEPP